MELPNVSAILAELYTDRMTVRRYRTRTDADGAVSTELDYEPALEDIPCRVSFGAKDNPRASGDKNSTELTPTLFCGPGVPLLRGDYVVVMRKGQEICSGRIGRPNPYGSSLQVQLYFEEES